MTSIRKRAWVTPSGTAKVAWQVDYRDQTGRRRAKQFSKKRDAEAWSVNAAAEVQKGIHTADSTSITVERAATFWLDSVRAAGREPTTIAAYEQHVRLHIVPKCGSRKLSQLTAPIVRSILDNWLLHLSRAMAVRVFRSFKAILNDAQERGYVAQNVANAVKVRKAPREKGKAHPPNKADLRAILAAADESDDLKGAAVVELAVFSGMRASELRGLAWRSIDFKRGRVTVEQRADAKGIIGQPKSVAGHRVIPLPARTLTMLKRWKLACPAHKLDLVFPSAKGRPLSHRILMKNLVGPIEISAGVTAPTSSFDTDAKEAAPRYAMHSFRHAAASLWIEQGLNPKRIQSLMGHSSIQVTFDTYGHLFAQAEKDCQDANAIERALFVDGA